MTIRPERGSSQLLPYFCAHRRPERNPTPGSLSTAKLVPFFAAADSQGPEKRELIKGKKWLLLSRWKNLTQPHRGELNQLFQMNRRVFKAYLLKESLERLWQYTYPGAMINYLQRWIDQLRWQRLKPFEELAVTLLKHLEGIANYCRTKVRMGVVEAVNGNIRMLINRGRGYKNLRYLLLKAKRLAVSNLELLAVRRIAKAA